MSFFESAWAANTRAVYVTIANERGTLITRYDNTVVVALPRYIFMLICLPVFGCVFLYWLL
jgi:hypothetical protein